MAPIIHSWFSLGQEKAATKRRPVIFQGNTVCRMKVYWTSSPFLVKLFDFVCVEARFCEIRSHTVYTLLCYKYEYICHDFIANTIALIYVCETHSARSIGRIIENDVHAWLLLCTVIGKWLLYYTYNRLHI